MSDNDKVERMSEKREPPSVQPTSEAELEGEGVTPAASPERVFLGTGLFWGLIVGLALALAVVILAAQNTGNVNISFLGWDFSTPLIVLILGSLLIGVVLDELFGLAYRKGRRRTLRDREELKRLR